MVRKTPLPAKAPYAAPETELLEIRQEEFILGYGNINPVEEENWGEG